MKHELKVILGPTAHETLVLVDNEPIGLIQDIKFHVGVNHTVPDIEIVFPNLLGPGVDADYAQNSVMVRQLKKTLELLKDLPHVKVTLQDLQFPKV